MRTVLSSSLALLAMTSTALAGTPLATDSQSAGPIQLSDAQMDQVTAGGLIESCIGGCVAIEQETVSGDNTANDNDGVDADADVTINPL